MPRMYTIARSITGLAITNDLVTITAHTSRPCVLHSCFVGQSSDAGDAQAEMLRIAIRRYATLGTGGTQAYAANPCDTLDAAFGGTNTVSNNVFGGTPTTMVENSFNVQAGWFYTPTPEERITIPAGGRLGIALMTVPNDGLTVQWTVHIEEL